MKFYKSLLPLMAMALTIAIGAVGCKKEKSPEPEPTCTGYLEVQNFEVEIDELPENHLVLATIPFEACEGTVTFYASNGICYVNSDGEITSRNHVYFKHKGGPVDADFEVTYTGKDTVIKKTITVRFNLRDVDDLGHFLTVSKWKYKNANAGEWVAITEQEYSNIKFDMGATVGGLGPSKFPNVSTTPSHSNSKRLIRNTYGGGQVARYIIAFKYFQDRDAIHKNMEVRYSADSNHDKKYAQVGGVLPQHGKGYWYFVLKEGFETHSTYSRIAMWTGDEGGVGYVDYPQCNVNYGAGYQQTTGGSYSGIAAAFQCLSVHHDWYED